MAKIDKMERQSRHYIVEAHENAAGQKKAVAQYNARGMTGRTQLRNDHMLSVGARNLEPLRHMFEVNFDKQTAAQLNSLLDAHYANSLGANHALSRQLERRNIAGANLNMRANLSEMVMKASRYIAGQKYNGSVNAVIQTGTGNVSYFPGNVAGSVNTGAIYQ